jgi:hypothetical protein
LEWLGWRKGSKEVTGKQKRREKKWRPGLRWMEGVELDLENMGLKRCRRRAFGRTEWEPVVGIANAKHKGLYNFRYQQMPFYICKTLFHNTAIPNMFRRLSRRHNQELYLGVHIKSICFLVGLNNISGEWVPILLIYCSNQQRNILIFCVKS